MATAKLSQAVALVAIAAYGVKCGELVEGTPGQLKALGPEVDTSKGAVAHRQGEGVKVVTLPDNAPAVEVKAKGKPGDLLTPNGDGDGGGDGDGEGEDGNAPPAGQ